MHNLESGSPGMMDHTEDCRSYRSNIKVTQHSTRCFLLQIALLLPYRLARQDC